MQLTDSGILILNKASGMTSQHAVTAVKRLLGVKKAGHSGILDPQVTGVLPIFLGRATRLAEYASDRRKCYEAVLEFGTATDTQDATGDVVARADPAGLDVTSIRNAFSRFHGVLLQKPPAYSALKIAGKRAYDLARAGQAVDLQPRPITVFELSIKDVHLYPGNYFVRFSIECGKGTYIRTICHDVGTAVGVPAHMRSLVRTCSGPFSLAEAHSLEEVAREGWNLVLAPDAAVTHFPALHLTEEQMSAVQHGQLVSCLVDDVDLVGDSGQDRTAFAKAVLEPDRDSRTRAGLNALGQLVRMYAPTGCLCALYEIVEGYEDRLVLRAKKVFCDAG